MRAAFSSSTLPRTRLSGQLQEGGPSDRLWPWITYHMAISHSLSGLHAFSEETINR